MKVLNTKTCCISSEKPKLGLGDSVIMRSWPGQFVQVGEDSLWDALYEVMVEAEGVDADEQGDGLPGYVYQVVVAQIQVLQSLQEVLREETEAETLSLIRDSYFYCFCNIVINFNCREHNCQFCSQPPPKKRLASNNFFYLKERREVRKNVERNTGK